ncbi:MAG: type IV secretory system conjugative DNA transfer family protein [Lachnospiraceae bacterium]|nr:type IV secretory system conjugative DNA transfer family protein [Lachnospiraceae bacterium]MDY4971846.1 type IV secretory system conjugative DNA transfer family protein [Lachnospiraceae bacterium]
MPKIEKYLEYPQDTRWATDEEIMSPLSSTKIDIAAPPFEAAGLILKSDGKTVYVDGMDNHSMILGSTGSGKSRLLCMPMIGIMANAGESFIITDPKEELFKMTSGMAREQGYQVVVLNFRDVSRGDMWNPLLLPYELYRKGDRDHAMSLLNDFVMTLAAADKTQEQFWLQMAQSLILANILLLFEAGKKEQVNMHSLSRMCLDYGRPRNCNALYQLLEYMNPDSIAAMNYAGVCVDAEKTQSSIMGVVHSILRVFNTQEELLRMMSDSTFDMRSFGRKKTAVYVIVPDEKSTFHFLVSIFTKQCYEMLVGEAHKEEDMRLPVRVNFVLDEFANLPTIPDMPNMISAARSRNIRFHLVIQSMNQLFGKYGHDADTISSNCENWVYLNSKEYDCLEEISKRCGNLMDKKDQQRPLITPSRLQRLDKARGETLIFHGRQYPYISYLADISRYDFEICRPVELKPRKRVPVSVFHADELLQELKSGKRAPLFYDFDRDKEKEAHLMPGENNSMDMRLNRLCRRRIELAEMSDFSQLLYYLLSTQKDVERMQRELSAYPEERELFENRLEAELVYRNSDLLACCAALAGENASEKTDTAGEESVNKNEPVHADREMYRNWLSGLYAETLCLMAEQGQQLLFYPSGSGKPGMVAAAGVGAAFYETEKGRYREAETILGYVKDYRDCFIAYPGLDTLLQRLQKFLQLACDRNYAESREMLYCMEEWKQPVSFQKKESDSLTALYRFRKVCRQDEQYMEKALHYCRIEYEYFLKWIKNKSRTEEERNV